MMRFVKTLATIVAVLACLFMLGACATISKKDPALELKPSAFRTPVNRIPNLNDPAPDDDEMAILDVYDPWEPMNRAFYDFNARLDRYVMLPVSDAYKATLPPPMRTGIRNFINNLNEFPIFVNCLLQGDMKKTGTTTGRFLLNSTFGFLGLVDVASGAGLERQNEDFGQTLGVWGMGPGPYFVMPLIGPSSVRDGIGFGVDFVMVYFQMMEMYDMVGIKDKNTAGWIELGIRTVDRRSNVDFRYHETGSPFEYELIRFIYSKKRELDIGE